MATAQKSPRSFNRRDSFSHSEQCDKFHSLTVSGGRKFCGLSVSWTDLFDRPPIKQLTDLFKHKSCRCWCHGAVNLFDPSADYALPEEYITSADRAFMLDETARDSVEFEKFGVVMDSEPGLGEPDSYGAETVSSLEWLDTGPGAELMELEPLTQPTASRTGFTDWSREELQRGKCLVCGDKLADCECVE